MVWRTLRGPSCGRPACESFCSDKVLTSLAMVGGKAMVHVTGKSCRPIDC